MSRKFAPAQQTIHEFVASKVELARIYAEDGALHTGARLLREAADMMEAHAKEFDDWMERAAK
jgi:hypothetical protein